MPVTPNRPAVCYVVSHYTSSGHTAHLPRFFLELSNYADVHVVAWSHADVPEFPGVASVTLLADKAPNRTLRLVAMVLLAWNLRRQGCRVFFIRIQDTVAMALSVVRKVMGIEVLLWRSGLHEHTGQRVGSGAVYRARRVLWHLRWKLVFPLIGRLVTRFVTGPASMMDYYHRNYRIPVGKMILLSNDVDVSGLAAESAKARPDVSRAKLGIDERAEMVTYVGRVAPLNLGDGKIIYRVADALLTRRPRAHLVLVGRRDFPTLQFLLEQAEWADRVHFTDLIPFRQVVGLYAATDVAIFPVVAAGFPRVVLEAMSMGVPFVSTDAGGVRDVAAPEQQSCIVGVDDVNGFVSRLEALLDDPEELQKMSAAGLRKVADFSTEVVARQFFEKIVRPAYSR